MSSPLYSKGPWLYLQWSPWS